MKIAFYAPMKPLSSPVPSGDLMIARDLVDFFKSRGHEVITVSEFETRWFYRSSSKTIRSLFSFGKALLKCLHFQPDLFLTYHTYYKAPDPFQPLLSYLFGKPYVICEAVFSNAARKSATTRMGYRLNMFALKKASHIFSNMSEDFENLKHVVASERLTYVPPSIDTDLFQRTEQSRMLARQFFQLKNEEVLICSVAMLRPDRKSEGVEFLLHSLARLQAKGIKFKFIHAGGGTELNRLRALSDTLLGGNGILLGQQTRPEILRLLQAADVFSFPGIDEGFGLVFVEAQAAELPVVAFLNGGIPDAVRNGETGILVELMNEDSYDLAMEKLITNMEYRQQMGKNGRAYVCDKHDRIKNYLKIVQKCESLV